MADGLFQVAMVTPEEVLLEGQARAVVLRSSDGDLTVLDGHTPLVTDVVPGEVRVDRDEGAVRLAVHGGYLQVEKGVTDEGAGTRVTLLAGIAELAETIDVTRAERARDEAASRVEELRAAAAGGGRPGAAPAEEAEEASGAPELAEAEAALRRAEVRLDVAGSGRGPGT